jgi:hypothetical protein
LLAAALGDILLAFLAGSAATGVATVLTGEFFLSGISVDGSYKSVGFLFNTILEKS